MSHRRCGSERAVVVLLIAAAAIGVGASGCRHRPPVDTTLVGVQARAPIDVSVGEVREENEDERTEAILVAVKAKLEKDYPPASVTRMPRDAHQKMHGCAVGTFTVDAAIAPANRVGLFSNPGQARPVIARFSNSDAIPQADKTPDARGLALKVLDVDGEKLIADEKHERTHDFMLINSPVFFVRSLEEYVGVLEAIERGRLARDAWFATHPHALRTLMGAFNTRIANPLEQVYFSATPYKFGVDAAKYRVRPCGAMLAPIPPDNPSPSYLRDAMKTSLAAGGACFEFAVQRRTNAASQPIEDPTVRWSEAEAPFVTVATLTFPAQDFDRPTRRDACRKMSFTPWHALDAHKPLGAINRVRLRVYELISRFRNRHNAEPHVEPTSIADVH